MPKHTRCWTVLVLCPGLLLTSLTHGADTGSSQDVPTAKQQTQAIPDPVATVNGEAITRAMLEDYVRQRQTQSQGQGADLDSPEARQQLIEDLVNQALLVQDAERQQLDQDSQFSLQMAMVRRTLLAGTAVRKVLAENPPDDAAIKAAYDQLIASQEGKKEYKARHILVDSQDKANAIIEQVNEGADFSELIASLSDQDDNATGGDLDWFSTDIVPAPFGEAVTALSKGEMTAAPVKTDFGWHVIVLDDVREVTPPSLDELKPQLTQQLQGQKLNEYLKKLRADAEVEIK